MELRKVPGQRRYLKAMVGCIHAAPRNLTCQPIRNAEATPSNLQELKGEGERAPGQTVSRPGL